jgi:hypothetical protein
MPLVVAAIIGAGGAITAQKISSSGQKDAADTTAAGTKYAADLQAKQNAEAVAFAKAQAENQFKNSEVSRRGNYDQWVAAQHRLGSVGDLIGMGPREIPDYVPGIDPNFEGGAPGASSSANGDPANQALVRDAIAHGLTGQAAIDYINQQKPGSAVLVPAGSPTPNGKIAWYDKGNGNGKFQMVGPENWEIKIDPALGPGWVFNPLGNGPQTASAPRSTVPAWNQPLTWNQPTYQNVPMTPALGMPPVRSVADYLGN